MVIDSRGAFIGLENFLWGGGGMVMIDRGGRFVDLKNLWVAEVVREKKRKIKKRLCNCVNIIIIIILKYNNIFVLKINGNTYAFKNIINRGKFELQHYLMDECNVRDENIKMY